MKIRIISLFLALVMAVSLVACTGQTDKTEPTPSASTEPSTAVPTEPTAEPSTVPPTESTAPTEPPTTADTPLFWSVSRDGMDCNFYLLGSIHASDGIIYPQKLLDAYNACEAVAVESDVIALEDDYTAMVEMMKLMLYTDGSKIYDHIDSELYDAAKALLQSHNLYNTAFDYYIPIFWSLLIENALLADTAYSSDAGVDRHFLMLAKQAGKEILEVEEYLDVYTGLAGLSQTTQAVILGQSVAPDYQDSYGDSVGLLLEAWKSGNLEELESLIFGSNGEAVSEAEQRATEEYNKMLLTDRNKKMVQAAVEYLEAGKSVFYVVGLAHMLGEDGIVARLTELGYTVTPVTY